MQSASDQPASPGDLERLGLSAEDLATFRRKAGEAFHEVWGPTEHTTIDELLALQDLQNPVRLSEADTHRIAVRYLNGLQKAATRLATELCEAVAYRNRLGRRQQLQIAETVRRCIQEITEKAGEGFADWITTYFTVVNLEESKQVFAQLLAEADERGGTTWDAMEAIRHLAVKFGAHAPLRVKAHRGRKKGQRYKETAELERGVQEIYTEHLERGILRPSTNEVVTELAKRKVSLPRKWKKNGITWNRVLSDRVYLRRFSKRLAKMAKDVRPVPENPQK